MADPAQPCTCTPYENICCCGPENGISVTQPQCQTLPDGSIVTNPAFVSNLNKSFWTYKFITDCGGPGTQAISNFGIPICELILADHITVSEKIDGCGEFVSVPFELIENDPNFGPAPPGFQYLKVETNDRYEIGVCVEYRVEIIGNYPIAIQPIKVKAGTPVLTFDCDNCYLVPDCNPQGELSITKECSHTIVDNQVTLNYTIDVDNIGSGVLTDVQFLDTIFIPTQLVVGTITVDPPTLNVDTSIPGEIIISGNIGDFNPGDEKIITYEIQITTVTEPGSFIVNNTATVTATGTQDTAICSTTVKAVKLRGEKTCSTQGNQASFTFTIFSEGNSPDILVDIFDRMQIPAGIEINVQSFNGCDAFFSGTTNPVPLNTPISGPVDFDILCNNELIPGGGSLSKTIVFLLVCSSSLGTSTIVNTLTEVTPVNPSEQVFLGAENIPTSANLDINLSLTCP